VRASIYTRISRDDAGDAAGVQRQEQDCLALCARRGWTVVATHVDNDFSAFSGRRRPAYAALLADIEQGRIEAVVAWAPERLHRSPRELEDFIELIERNGTVVETIKAGSWDVSSSHGRLVARMLGAVSRAESERTGERVSRAHQQAKERGYWRGPIPYGMRATPRPGLPQVDPTQADLVRDVLERVARGDALTRIAFDLNAAGHRPRRGNAWTHTGIQRLIASPALGGMVSVDGELKPAAFEGVVEETQWRAARAAIRRRPRGESRRPREKLTLLGGLLRCVEHGHVCVGSTASHGPVYVAGQPGQCYVSIKREAADTLVREVVLARLAQSDARQVLQPGPDTIALEAEALALRCRREDLADLVMDGLLPPAAARPRLAALAERLTAIEAMNTPALIEDDAFVDPRKAWDGWTMPQRRELIRLLFSEVRLRHKGPRQGPRADPTRVELTWAHA